MSTSGRSLWIGLHLLDRQIVDIDQEPVAKVDDLELEVTSEPGALPTVTGILCGPAALGWRFGPRTGALLAALRDLLRGQADEQPVTIPAALISDIGASITLNTTRDTLSINAVEAFLGEHVIGHVPGAGAAGPADEDEATS